MCDYHDFPYRMDDADGNHASHHDDKQARSPFDLRIVTPL